MSNITKITVIGAGVMGNGIALVAAKVGKYEVNLVDLNQVFVDRGISSIFGYLKKSLKKGKISKDDMEDILNRIKGTTKIEEAVLNSDFIIETATENKIIKKNILKKIGKIIQDRTIITSNTSSIKITELATVLQSPENFCGMHFFNPPQTMELVEIARGIQTADSTVQTVIEVANNMGKETVILKKDYPGFIVNRILIPALNEAVNLYASQVADKEDIDRAVKVALKWPIGPLKLIDQIGLDTINAIGEILGEGDNTSKFAPNPIIKEMVEKGLQGRKTGKGFYEWE